METHLNKYTTASLTAIIATLLLLSMVFAASDTAPTTAGVSVNEFLSVTLSNAPVTFPAMDPGTGPTNATTGTGNPLTATIGSESNIYAQVKTSADALNFVGTGSFSVSFMEWSADTQNYANYTTGDVQVCTTVAPGSACDIYHRLTIPGATPAGAYSVDITITVTNV